MQRAYFAFRLKRLKLVGQFCALRDTSLADVGPMFGARVGHSVTLLADGRVLIVGGSGHVPDRGDSEPIPAELFDPTAIP